MLTQTISVLVPAVLAGTSLGGILTSNDLQSGQTTQRLAYEHMNLDVAVTGGHLSMKSKAGYDIMGISGGAVHGEIDHSEMMGFTFDKGVSITSLELGLLFIEGQHSDRVNEGATIVVNGTHTFELRLETATKASWYGNGTVTNHSAGLEGSAGIFEISDDENIFGMLVTSLELRAPDDGFGGSVGSDYGFTSMGWASPVPTPGAASLLGLGGLLAVRRRR